MPCYSLSLGYPPRNGSAHHPSSRQFKLEYVDVLSSYAKFMFEIGKYDASAVVLTHLAVLVSWLNTDGRMSLTATQTIPDGP